MRDFDWATVPAAFFTDFRSKSNNFAKMAGIDKHHRLPVRTTLLAVFLMLLGFGMLALGLHTWRTDSLYNAGPFLTIGGIAFIPGSYASYILYMTWAGYRGFTYTMVPQFADE